MPKWKRTNQRLTHPSVRSGCFLPFFLQAGTLHFLAVDFTAQDVNNAAISGAMTRNRFEELMMCFHVADNEHLPVGDRMAKVRPLFTAMNERFVAAFPRHTHLSIDESMVPYYGRHSAKQFIRGKPIRF